MNDLSRNAVSNFHVPQCCLTWPAGRRRMSKSKPSCRHSRIHKQCLPFSEWLGRCSNPQRSSTASSFLAWSSVARICSNREPASISGRHHRMPPNTTCLNKTLEGRTWVPSLVLEFGECYLRRPVRTAPPRLSYSCLENTTTVHGGHRHPACSLPEHIGENTFPLVNSSADPIIMFLLGISDRPVWGNHVEARKVMPSLT